MCSVRALVERNEEQIVAMHDKLKALKTPSKTDLTDLREEMGDYVRNELDKVGSKMGQNRFWWSSLFFSQQAVVSLRSELTRPPQPNEVVKHTDLALQNGERVHVGHGDIAEMAKQNPPNGVVMVGKGEGDSTVLLPATDNQPGNDAFPS